MHAPQRDLVIGIDIGGTHTDGVILGRNQHLLSKVKVPSTDPVRLGFRDALKRLCGDMGDLSRIHHVAVSSTCLLNAMLTGSGLHRVGVLRLAGHRPDVPAGLGWPHHLARQAIGATVCVEGGYECDGTTISPLDREEVLRAAERFHQEGIVSIAVVGTFSCMYPQQELECQSWIRSEWGDALTLSLSHRIGGLGIMERENATILNAATQRVLTEDFLALEREARSLGIRAPVLFVINDGTLSPLSDMMDSPILSMAAGATNSLVGGAFLAQQANALVIDIGGTSTDAGRIQAGCPLKSIRQTEIGGVPLSLQMPELLSRALGGGSLIKLTAQGVQIEPRSLGSRLTCEALSFGGSQLTLTDAALRLGHCRLPGATLAVEKGLPEVTARQIVDAWSKQLEQIIRQGRGAEQGLPVVFVGGGASLLPDAWLDEQRSRPPHFEVANAVGAALSLVGASIDIAVAVEGRADALSLIEDQLIAEAIRKGADRRRMRILDRQWIPYPYCEGLDRLIMRVGGPMQI